MPKKIFFQSYTNIFFKKSIIKINVSSELGYLYIFNHRKQKQNRGDLLQYFFKVYIQTQNCLPESY